MANHELQLHDIIDKDRFHIIDLYKQNTILWCREIAASRDKTQAAWTQIANDASSPNRTIPVSLIQKIVKNLRDQHTRLLRRGGNSSWKFQNALKFLGSPPPSKKTNKSTFNAMKLPKKPKKVSIESPISFVKVEEKPLPDENSIDQLIESIKSTSSLNDESPICSHSNETKQTKNTNQASSSNANQLDENYVQLNAVTDSDRLKIIELYKQQPILWNKSSNGQRDKICEAWQIVVDGISTPSRRFDLPLVQKIAKNLKDQFIRIKRRRGVNNSNWKYLPLLTFLDSNSSNKNVSTERKKAKSSPPKTKSVINKPTKNHSNESIESGDVTNPFLSNLSLLSLVMPLMQQNNAQSTQNPNNETVPLTSKNLAAVQADLFRDYPDQIDKSPATNRETMIAAWSMIVGSYMSNTNNRQ